MPEKLPLVFMHITGGRIFTSLCLYKLIRMADDKLKRYEKIDFLGEGQVSNESIVFWQSGLYASNVLGHLFVALSNVATVINHLFTERYFN